MSTSSTQTRQMEYGVAILVLFVVMFPYTAWLREKKSQEQLGEATIGQIDTGSFLVKLALLGGARGIAANWFWMRAIDLQKVHEWDKLETTVNVITKLQPHFLMVWTWQGWNLAYNVSVEWDAPEDKYEWIKKGTKFLQEGVQKNVNSPDLVWDTAWTYYNKIGFSDEAIILRRLFHDDNDQKFKSAPGEGGTLNDNYLVAHGWFRNSVLLADKGNARLTTAIEYVDKPTQ